MSTRKQATLRETTVGRVRSEVLAFTVGDDPRLDLALVAADCLGSAAHATMLSRLPARVRPFGVSGRRALIRELRRIMVAAREGRFTITAADQDVHLAVERELTQRLGVLGKQIHTARSRNDQIAVDLRLLAREQLLGLVADTGRVAAALLALARRGRRVPMVGRTHLQPAMTSSVGLWAAAYAESLFDDITLLRAAYALNDACPLGAAAGYGVPWPVDRSLTARLLGFRRPVHNVLHAIQARGKVEGAILAACAQVMVSLSRLAQDLMIFTLPEFGYFSLPEGFGTGSSIMPQKYNPDVLELIRARAARVLACELAVMEVVRGLPGGYNRDLQETKGPLLEGLAITRGCLRILPPLLAGLKINRRALLAGFTPGVFAAERVLELVAGGRPFREAYQYVKAHLRELQAGDPYRSLAAKRHLGAPGRPEFKVARRRLEASRRWAQRQWAAHCAVVRRLLGVRYPLRGMREGV